MNLFLLVIFLVLAACRVGPEYTPPPIETEDDWITASSTTADPVDDWWTTLNDPQLNNYIALAIKYNNDVKVAEASISQARAARMVSASALFPRIAADTNANHYYFSKNGPLFAFTPTSPIPTVQIPRMQNIYNANLDALWEIDLFGKTRRGVEAADARYESTIEQRNDILLSVLAEVANSYVQIRSAQAQGILIENNIALLAQTNALAEERYQKGLTNQLDAKRLNAELAQAKSVLPPIIAEIYQGIYALSVLTGSSPETLLEEFTCIKPLPEAPACVALGFRSDILRRRPDVRSAERELAAATADIGVAVANFFPTFTLNGLLGLQSVHLHNLFSGSSKTWSYGADLYQPLFQGGRLVGNFQEAEAAAAGAYYTYQQTVLAALQEAESALVAYQQDLQAVDLLEDAVSKTSEVSTLMNQRFKSGLVSVTDWLDSERQLIASQQNLLSSQTSVLLDLIHLYKALGGGVGEPVVADCN